MVDATPDCDGVMSLTLFYVICACLALLFLTTWFQFKGVKSKLEAILSDPRNKLMNAENYTRPASLVTHFSKQPDKEFGSQELDNLKERAFLSRSNTIPRKLSMSFSFRKQEEKEYEWEIKWKEVRLEVSLHVPFTSLTD